MRILPAPTLAQMAAKYKNWHEHFALCRVPILNGEPGEYRWLETVWRKADMVEVEKRMKHGGPMLVPFVYMAMTDEDRKIK